MSSSDDERPHLSQAERNAAPDAGCSAGDHRDFALQREKLRCAFFDSRLMFIPANP